MTVYAITDTKKGRTGIAPTYLQTTQKFYARSVHLEPAPGMKWKYAASRGKNLVTHRLVLLI